MPYSRNTGAMASLILDQVRTRGVSPTLLATMLVTPSTTPAHMLIWNDSEPRQCAITWIRRSPT